MSISSPQTNNSMKQRVSKIIIIGTYFGKWPVWFPAFLLSCIRNETIEWLFFTDCEIPSLTYPNITFEPMTLRQLNDLASKKLGFHVDKGTFSQLELRPAYGVLFDTYIRGFDFWGHCDVDIVWGDIRNFIPEEILQTYDIVSCRKEFLAGHLTLWRNAPETNTLFRAVPRYREIFSSHNHHGFDELVMSLFLRSLLVTEKSNIRVYWPEQMTVWFYGDAAPIGWCWENGKILDAKRREYIYIHFQDWKKFVTTIDFQLGDQPPTFKFTQVGIQAYDPSSWDLSYKKFKQYVRREPFSKPFRRFMQFLRLLKMVLRIRNFYWAQRLLDNSINIQDIQIEWKTGDLFFKRLNLRVGKQQNILPESYDWALQLVNQCSAKFYNDKDYLSVDIAGLRASIQSAEDALVLKRLLVDGIYNLLFSRPSIVVDIGMNVGLTTICFANQPDVVVVGYEPCEKKFKQALHNISLNPKLCEKIHTVKSSVSDAKFQTIAIFLPTTTDPSVGVTTGEEYGMGPKFEYEEIEIEDAAEALNSVITQYPKHDVIVKIDLERSDYHIDGVTEHHIISQLQAVGLLNMITVIMIEWHKPKPQQSPPAIAYYLSDYGFEVFLFTPHHPHEGMLYAIRRTSSGSIVEQP